MADDALREFFRRLALVGMVLGGFPEMYVGLIILKVIEILSKKKGHFMSEYYIYELIYKYLWI